jgi:antirestriction protein ArdC
LLKKEEKGENAMTQGQEKFKKARELSAKIARMSQEERERLSAKMVSVFNPEGHQLTLHNTLLLMGQCEREDLTLVAGFKQWIKAGRVVRKGEHTIGFINVPIHKKAKDASEDDKGKLYFKLVPVFDVSQTDELQAVAS